MKMMTPKVSIIVPCWNVEKYLDRCIDSLVSQTLREIEIILVDDDSPDSVPEMCERWAEKDSRIKVIHKSNAGAGYARNSGLEAATGEYVAFVDADDYVRNDAYQLYYEAAASNNADIVFSGINSEMQPGVWKQTNMPARMNVLNKEQSWLYAKGMVANLPHVKSEKTSSCSVWHSIYKRSNIMSNNIRFLSEREIVSEDLLFQLDFMKTVNNSVFIPQALYYYCLNDNSLSFTFKKERFEGQIKLRGELLKRMSDDSDASYRANRRFIAGCRVYSEKLAVSKLNNKLHILRKMLDNEIWKEVGKDYKPSYLPLHQSIIYRLQLNHHSILLLLFSAFVMKAKPIFGKKTN